MVTRNHLVGAAALGIALVAIAAGAPLVVALGMTRLVGLLLAALGAWLLVGRVGAIDLSVGAAVGAGGVGAGILAGEVGLPALAVLPVAVIAGAAVGAVAGAVAGRLGRLAGALATLAWGAGVVAVARGVAVTGGRSGYHAVPLLVGGDRTDAAVAGVLLCFAGLAVGAIASSRTAARAAVAVAAPPVAQAAGRSASLDVALLGAVAGGVLGAGGLVQAAASGSVAVDGAGPDLTATLVLVAVLAEALRPWLGRTVLAPLVAGLVVLAPSIVFPLAPLVGTAPPLLVMGPIGLAAVVLLRRVPGGPAGTSPAPTAATGPTAPPTPRTPSGVWAAGLAVPGGTLDVAVAPGELVALVGPNGAGKSTILARLGGQLPDDDATQLGADQAAAATAPRGAAARARLGLARTWQQAPDVDPLDLLAATDGDADAQAWAEGVLPRAEARGAEAVVTEAPAARARAALVALTARRPGVVLLDEPSAPFPGDGAQAVAAWLRGLADGGAAVLVVEHRPEVIAVADRILTLERP